MFVLDKTFWPIRQRSQYAGETLKTQISMVRPTIYANPSLKRSFLKTLFKPEEFENARFLSSYVCHDNHVISLTVFSSNTYPK